MVLESLVKKGRAAGVFFDILEGSYRLERRSAYTRILNKNLFLQTSTIKPCYLFTFEFDKRGR